MKTLYKSKKTTVNLNEDGKIVKTIMRPLNEKEHEIQKIASNADIAPKIYSSSFNNVEKILTIEMEYINGLSLDEYLKKSDINKLKLKHALIDMINRLYDLGIDHRDLCGENIIVTDNGRRPIVKILDYGDAVLYQEPIPYRSRTYHCLSNRNW